MPVSLASTKKANWPTIGRCIVYIYTLGAVSSGRC